MEPTKDLTKTLYLYDRKNCEVGDPVTISKDDVETVRQRFYKDDNGKSVEGCVVKMKPGGPNSPREFQLANLASDARRIIGVITRDPAGSEARKIES